MTMTTPDTKNGAKVDASDALATVEPMQRYNLALEPQGYDGAMKLAELCAKMKLCGCTSPDDAFLRIVAGRAIGLPSMASVQSIIPIYNEKTDSFTLTMYVKAKLALVLSRPDVIEYIRPETLTDQKAVWVGKRVGGKEQPSEFTWDDAVKAGLVGRGADGGKTNNYDRHPKVMLSWRAAGRLLDIIAGDILNGIASHEDVNEANERGDEPRGVVPESIKQYAVARNWSAEADQLKKEMIDAAAAKNPAAMKVVRARVKTFETEAPPNVAADLQDFYAKLKSGAAPATTAAPTPPAATATKPAETPKAAQATATAGAPATPTPTPAAPPAAAAPRGDYLPPNKRGDNYDGPDDEPLS